MATHPPHLDPGGRRALLEEQGDRLTGAQRESLGIVQRNAEQLVALIEDLLDI